MFMIIHELIVQDVHFAECVVQHPQLHHVPKVHHPPLGQITKSFQMSSNSTNDSQVFS
jgi:hypothetical protein